MKFLVDAQLPRRLVQLFATNGHDVVHTLDLPDGNQTKDHRIIEFADRDGRVVVTKDSDFVDGHLLRGRPANLLLVSTGSISNAELERLFGANLSAIETAFAQFQFAELGRQGLLVRS